MKRRNHSYIDKRIQRALAVRPMHATELAAKVFDIPKSTILYYITKEQMEMILDRLRSLSNKGRVSHTVRNLVVYYFVV